MRCPDEEKLSWYMDGEAPELKAHVDGCAECRAKLERLSEASVLLAQTARRFLPEAHPGSIRRPSFWRSRPGRAVLGSAAALMISFVSYWIWMNQRTPDPLDVHLVGSGQWAAGTDGVLRAVVRNAKTGQPVQGARVRAWISNDNQTEVVSGPDGTAELRLRAGDGGTAQVILTVISDIGRAQVQRPVTVRRTARLLLSTDKPMYQPDQEIHVRALALDAATFRPLAGDVEILIEDANGNRVHRKTLRASDYGIAALDFRLADEVVMGRWRISAIAHGERAERTVDVSRYVLPKFRVDLETDEAWYEPGGTVKAKVHAGYLFGKPVSGARVRLELAQWKVDTFVEHAAATASADARGRAEVELPVPAKLFGTEREGGDATVRLIAVVTDGAGHVERKSVLLPVTKSALRLSVVPEGGKWAKDVPGNVYVLASYADGTPARVAVKIVGGASATTDDSGLAVLPAPGPVFKVAASDEKGRFTEVPVNLAEWPAGPGFLLRLDRASCRAGETLGLDVLTSRPGFFSIDIAQGGRTVLTKSLDVTGGAGRLALDVPSDLQGTFRVTAWRFGVRGEFLKDVRWIRIESADDVRIRALPAKDPFAPGEDVRVDFQLSAPGALSLSVVDEAVFALADARPGFEKELLAIEEELTKPRWQFKDPAPFERGPFVVRCAMTAEPDVQVFARMGFWDEVAVFQRRARKFNEAATFFSLLAGIVLGIGGLLVVAHRAKGPQVSIGCAIFAVVGFVLVVLLLPSLASARKSAAAPGGQVLVRKSIFSMSEGAATGGDQQAEVDPPTTGDVSAPRIREYFPETLYWNPQIVTDADGRASVTFPGADSITTWRMGMSAITKDGRLGSADAPLRVFQPFFVDIDLPVALTQGDEVWVPVAVYNYLKEPQRVDITFEAESGFDVVDGASRTLEIAPGDVTAVHVHVRAREFGSHRLLVKAIGTQFSDAVRRTIDVHPDGKEMPFVVSDSLARTTRRTFTVPESAIDGASRAWVRLYPSRFSEIVTGLEGLVRMPYG